MMRVGLILLCCLFVIFVRPGTSFCTVSKYNDETGGNWVKCSNSSLREALDRGGEEAAAAMLAAITISRSKIPTIPENAFIKSSHLRSLNLHDCGIRKLHPNALTGLALLKKLSLSSNDITTVEAKWFSSLLTLEQLDLSFNMIRNIEPLVFAKLANIRRLNLDDNLLTCLEPKDMTPLRSIAKIRVLENPLSLVCRGKMTLWFNDKGINYLSDLPTSPSWLDRVLWLCAEDGYASSGSAITEITGGGGGGGGEKRMRECVLFNIFHQLRSALKTTNSYPISTERCASETRTFLQCLARNTPANNDPPPSAGITDGQAIANMISNLRTVQDKLK